MRIILTIVGIVLIVIAGVIPMLFEMRTARAAQLLKPGDLAPTFSSEMVLGGEIQPVKLSDFRGKKLILYFYPKDNTSGCTKEACAFRDGFARFQSAGFAILGCSVDSAESHKSFIRKYSLPFPLLLDRDHKIAEAYGVANGIPILGLDRRITYVIDEQGRILKVYPRVDPAVHASEIIRDLDIGPASTKPAMAPGVKPAG
ncbi:MAG: peroxiredoxin [Candidatus Binataceae bacterium]